MFDELPTLSARLGLRRKKNRTRAEWTIMFSPLCRVGFNKQKLDFVCAQTMVWAHLVLVYYT